MPYLEWNDKFSLGVPEFDEHHWHLIDLLNRVHDAFSQKSTDISTERVLKELLDYATYHFCAEEFWMQNNGYPEFEKHRAEHESFISRVLQMQKDMNAGSVDLSTKLLQFMKDWVSTHILMADADYGKFNLALRKVQNG